MPTDDKTEIPSTILRSDQHAQAIWTKTHDSAVETYGEGGRAHRVAYAALKHEYEKRGDKWVRKAEKGRSDKLPYVLTLHRGDRRQLQQSADRGHEARSALMLG